MHLKRLQAPICATVAAALVLAPSSGSAVLPALMAQQIVKQLVQGQLRQQVLSMFAGSGCKGPSLAGAGALAGGPGPAKAPARILGKFTMPSLGHFLGGAQSSRPSPVATEAAPATDAQQGGPGGAPAAAAPEGAAPPSHQNAANGSNAMTMAMSPGMAFASPELAGPMQRAAMMASPQMNQTASALESANAHPLSRAETLKVFGELNDLGLMEHDQLREAQECLDGGGATAERTLGMSAAFMSTSVLPTLRQVKEQFANLTPEEQSQLATEIAEQLRQAPPESRRLVLEGYGTGLFPPTVLQEARAKLGAR